MKINLDTQLSMERTRFSAERTLLSWIRTSFSMITFGFGLFKFIQYLLNNNPNATAGARNVGIFFILLGIFCLIPGIIEHRKILSQLHKLDSSFSRWSYAIIVAIMVWIIGLYALLNTLVIRSH